LAFGVALATAMVAPTPGFAACRTALVLALDISSSIDRDDYALQMQGLAAVLDDREVREVLLVDPQTPVMLAVFEWAGRDDQRLIVDWTRLQNRADLAAISATLRRQIRPDGTRSTAIGRALAYGGGLMQQVPDCWRHIIDISGDGKNNDGIRPEAGKAAAIFERITVNGLVIGKAFETTDQIAGNKIADLTAYFRQQVLHGPGAFIQTALGFQDFARAMKKKILREMTLAVSNDALSPPRVGEKQLLAIDLVGRNQALPVR